MNFDEQNLHELYSKFNSSGLLNHRIILRTLDINLPNIMFFDLMMNLGYIDKQNNICDEYKNTGSIIWGTEYFTNDKESVMDYSLYISVKHLPRILEKIKSNYYSPK